MSNGTFCAACDNKIVRIAALEAELEAEIARADKAVDDRRVALSVTSKDGLLSSEWVMRTGRAERRIAELETAVHCLQAENAKQKRIIEIEQRRAERYGPCPDHSGKDRGGCLMCRNEQLEAENARLWGVFQHYHVASESGGDECAKCGLDLRDPIHWRATP